MHKQPNIRLNAAAYYGSLTLVAGGIGHLVLIDLLALKMQSSFIQWKPLSLLNDLKKTSIDFGALGSNNAFSIFSGFSLWITISLIAFGLFQLTIMHHLPGGHTLRVKSMNLTLIVSVIFTVLAAMDFIYPAALGGVLATLLFSIGVLKEKQLNK